MTKVQREVCSLRNRGLTYKVIGSQLGISRQKASELYRATEPSGNGFLLEENAVPIDRFQPIRVTGDAVVTSDWHVPLHDPKMVNHVLRAGEKFGIKQLLIGGDFWHMDSFGRFSPHQPEASFELEREQGTQALDKALDVYEDVYLCLGNHDYRIAKFLEFRLSFDYCMRWVLSELSAEKQKRLHISDLDYIIYETGGRTIRLCHQKNFSKVPLQVPRQLAQKYHMSIIAAHSHHFAQGVALDGHNLIFEGGGLFDPERTEYIQDTNLNHRWVPGFHMFHNGIPYAFSPAYGNLGG